MVAGAPLVEGGDATLWSAFDLVVTGTVVDIEDRTGEWVGRGFYNGHSRIALRVLTERPEEIVDADFFRRRIARALALRRGALHVRCG